MKLSKKAIYYHGLGGSADLDLKYKMQKLGYYLITENVDFYKEWFKDRGQSFMFNQIKKYKNIDLILGLSFGAHPAYLLSKATGADLLLINPAVNRRRSTTGIGTYITPIINKKSKIEIYFGQLDNVVPKQYTIEFFNQTGEHFDGYTLPGAQHNLYREEFNLIIDFSPLIKNNIAEIKDID